MVTDIKAVRVADIPDPALGSLSRYSGIDNNFRSEERGIIAVNFRIFPEWGKDWTAQHVQSLLDAKGVRTWSPAFFEGATLKICFVTGFPPLIIVGIIVAGLVAIAAISAITVYKMVVTNTEISATQQERGKILDSALEAIDQLPPEQQATLLRNMYTVTPYPEVKAPLEDVGKLPEGINGTVMLVLMAGIGALALFLVVKR